MDHWLAGRVRARVFLCMLGYNLEWHMRRRLAQMLFDETDKEAAEAQRRSVVAQAQRSNVALSEQTTGQTLDGLPVYSFRVRPAHGRPTSVPADGQIGYRSHRAGLAQR
ncbi:hypothetical protein [Rhodopila sp.]|uniref:hypothetical protein n=1 Tax=Rhodopila sp. TaxID=2480087 RepID=UPI003D143C82